MKCNMKKLFLLGCLAFTVACQSQTLTPARESTPTRAPLTPTQAATATGTFTPTPALTPTPIPLFFTDNFDSESGAWFSFQTGGEGIPRLTLESGLLRLDITSPDTWYYAIHSSHDYKDVHVGAKFAGTPPGSIGLICRYSEAGWFEFNIASDGTYNVLFAQWLADDIARYTPIASDPSEYLQAANLSYEIGLTCQEGFLLLHVNGKLFRKLDVSRYGLTQGKIGLSAASFGEPSMIAAFDWVRVSEPGQ